MASVNLVGPVKRGAGDKISWRWRCAAVAVALMMAASAPVAWAQDDAAAPGTVGDDVVLPPTAATSEGPEVAAKYPEIAEAMELVIEGDLDAAVEKLKEATDAHDELSPPRLILAQLLFSLRQPTQNALGRTVLEDVVHDNPEDPEAFMTLGEIAIREGRLAEATLSIEHADELLATLEGNEERLENLQIRLLNYKAKLAESRGDWEGARTELEAWVERDPEAAQAQHRLGIVLFQLGEYDAAYEALRKGEEGLDRVRPSAVSMAILYEREGDRTKATEWMNRALEEKPDDLITLLSAAQWMLQTRQYDEAKPLVEKAVEQNPDSLEAKILSGLVARFRGDLPAAERYFESAHLQSPGNLAASNNLALTLVEQDNQAKLRRAHELAQLNISQFGNNGTTVATLGWVYYHLGRLEEASRLFEALVNSRQISADGLYYMAKVSEKRGKKDEARQQLTLALESDVPFAYEREAKELVDQLGAGSPSP